MIMILLSILDIIGGIMLFHPLWIANIIGIAILIKGTASVIGSFASGFYMELPGAIDIIAGLALMFSWNIPFIPVILLAKGIIFLMSGLFIR